MFKVLETKEKKRQRGSRGYTGWLLTREADLYYIALLLSHGSCASRRKASHKIAARASR